MLTFDEDREYPAMKGHLVQYAIPHIMRNVLPRRHHDIEVGAVGVAYVQDGWNIKIFFRPGVCLWFHHGELKRIKDTQ